MSVTATYEAHIDLNNDGDFSDASEDVSPYVVQLSMQCGVNQPGDRMARSATLQVVLDNSSHKFSPEHASALAGFTVGRLIRFRMIYDGVTQGWYQGWISPKGIRPEAGTRGHRFCTVRSDGYLVRLQNEQVKLPPMQSVRTGDVVRAILANTKAKSPTLNYLAWDKAGSVWDTALWGAGAVTAEDGLQEYAYIGDGWRANTSVYAALKDMAVAEQGMCFEDRDGNIVFWGRDHFLSDLQNAAAATWTGAYVGRDNIDYVFGANIANSVVIHYNPRTLDQSLSVVAVGERVTVPRYASVTVSLSFRDAAGNPVGALNILTPVASVDWRAADNGKDLTKYVTCQATAYADRVDVTFTNKWDHRVFILAGWTVRGNALHNYGQMQVEVQAADSIDAYGPYPAPSMSIPVLQDAESAQTMATWFINRNKVPRGSIRGVTLNANEDHAHMVDARDRYIGDRITFSEDQTGTNADYWIVGVQHNIMSHREHKVTYLFEPIPATTLGLWDIAGYSEWDSALIWG